LNRLADPLEFTARETRVSYVKSHYPPGFGDAVRAGLDHFTGDAVAIAMADGSDAPRDVVRYYRLLEDGNGPAARST
jgi:dolichol-phosphate mannosyltransferase